MDEPPVLAHKEARLPAAACPNELRRVPVEFAAGRLGERLAPFAGRRPVVVVVEGVLMYLDADAVGRLLRTVRGLFPGHRLVCDLMTRPFAERYARTLRAKLAALRASFARPVDRPAQPFLASGYREVERVSVAGRAAELGALRVPPLLVRTVLRTLRRGYAVHVFDA